MRLVALSIVCFAALSLTGCGKKQEDFVSVKVFKGGYGDDFFIEAGEEYAKANGVTVKTEGDPRMWDRLRPDFVAGTPPDCTWPGWGMDYWGLVYDGQVEPMDEYLQQPAFGQSEGTWLDTFDADLMKLGQYDGKQYLMPFHVNINGWWYNKTVFEKNGWTVPTTFDELLALGPKMKAAGVAPITFQGQYPYYMLYGFIYPWAISSGGVQAWNDCQGLVPGAWKSEHILRAAKAVEQLRDAGFFLEGSLALDHIQSETQFLEGNAGMVPCGTWLYAEMENSWPQGVVAEFMLPPVFADGKGDPTALMVAIEPFIIPSKAKHKKDGVEYYRYITSREKAKQFVEEKGTLMAIKGLDDAVYPSHLQRPAELFAQAKTKWHSEYRFWYKELAEEAENAMSALLEGKINAQAFCDRLEAKAEETRNNPKIKKHTVG
jgi:N-acetylglucosamine transport system substrate-binding protein